MFLTHSKKQYFTTTRNNR